MNQYWMELVERGIATEEEIMLVTDIMGYREEVLDNILYQRTGFRSLEQMDAADE